MFHVGMIYFGDQSGTARRPMGPEISWIGAVILIFAAIVPTPTRKTIVAALIAVSMNPVGMLIARSHGAWDFGAASNVLLMHYPDFLLVGAAAVISHVVTHLGRQVTRAREMGSYKLEALLVPQPQGKSDRRAEAQVDRTTGELWPHARPARHVGHQHRLTAREGRCAGSDGALHTEELHRLRGLVGARDDAGPSAEVRPPRKRSAVCRWR